MKIYLEREDLFLEIEFTGTVIELLKQLKVNKNTVVVDVNGIISELTDNISNNDKIKILDVVTGG